MSITLALWATIGLLLSAVGWAIDTWQFWCFVGVFWAVDQLSRQRGRIDGIIDYLEMSEADQRRIKQALDSAKEELK